MSNSPVPNISRFRKALGSFATGVTIVTTRDSGGRDAGLTVNSFNSVSLDPPLVLWSLSRSASSLPAFLDAEYFAVRNRSPRYGAVTKEGIAPLPQCA